MVAVRNHEADRYIGNLPNNISVFLVFGPDSGLVSERVNGILARVIDDRHDPFQLVAMAGDDIADDPGLLSDEANTIGLFQTRRAIQIATGRKSFVNAIKILVAEPPSDCTIIITAGVLRRDAPLRTVCVRAKTAATIECYPDQDRDIARLIDTELRESNLSIAPAAKNALVAALGADRLTTRMEIEKLILFARGQQEISEEDVYAVVAGAAGHLFDDAVDAAYLGKRTDASEIYSQVSATGEDLNVLMSACVRRCLLLHRMRQDIESGMQRDQAMEKHGQSRLPPVRKASIGSQVSQWNSDQLIELLEKLGDISFRIRQDSALAPVMAARMLWMIASNRSARAPHVRSR